MSPLERARARDEIARALFVLRRAERAELAARQALHRAASHLAALRGEFAAESGARV